MIKRILSVVLLVALLTTGICAFAEPETAAHATEAAQEAKTGEAAEVKEAAPAVPQYTPIKELMEKSGMSIDEKGKKHPVCVSSASFDNKAGVINFTIANASDKDYKVAYVMETDENSAFQVIDMQQYSTSGNAVPSENRMCSSISQVTIAAGEKVNVQEKVVAKGKKAPKFNIFVQYSPENGVVSNMEALEAGMGEGYLYVEDMTNPASLKATAASGSSVFAKIGAYLLHNILAIIAILLSAAALLLSCKKNCAKKEEIVVAEAEVATEEVAVEEATEEFAEEVAAEEVVAEEAGEVTEETSEVETEE